MKKAILFLFAFFIIGGVIDTASAQGAAQETVSIGVNKSKKILDRSATIRVLTVVEDSRCPEGTTCVQAGNAKVRISIQKGTRESQIVELDTNGKTTATVAGYELKLDSLTPTPTSAAPIRKKDYVANLTVKDLGSVASN